MPLVPTILTPGLLASVLSGWTTQLQLHIGALSPVTIADAELTEAFNQSAVVTKLFPEATISFNAYGTLIDNTGMLSIVVKDKEEV